MVGEGGAIQDGTVARIAGWQWVSQTAAALAEEPGGGLAIGPGGDVRVLVRSGERPWFDPPRKVRAEFCGLERYLKGAPIRFRFDFRADPVTSLAGLDWFAIAQVHQADLHYEDGSYVGAPPIFAIGLAARTDGAVVEVTIGTKPGPMREPVVDPATGRQRNGPKGPEWRDLLPDQKLLGHSAPLARDRWHAVEFTVVDGHGGPGRVFVEVDGAVVVDQRSIATGYGYADALANVTFQGGPQDTGSYLKFGVYAGLWAGERPPAMGVVALHYRHIGVDR